MPEHYFSILHSETPNRFWINNPTEAETDLAISHGAVACTTNPAYCARLLSAEPEYLRGLIDDTICQTSDIDLTAVVVYQKAARRIMRAFMPLYQRSDGTEGFVTMQDDPRTDHDTRATTMSIEAWRMLSPNYMAKIPVIEGGMEAIDYCVERNVAICATEVFALAQARALCERYERATERTGNRPPFFVTHITGIFDEYLKKLARRERIDIDPGFLDQAGLAVARKQYWMLKDAGFHVTMLGGGVREPHHLTGLIGGDVHVTVNWSTADQIISSGVTAENRIDDETPAYVIEELRSKLPDFRKAYDDDGLLPGEFHSYGPVQLFRNAFLTAWYSLLAEIASRKHTLAL